MILKIGLPKGSLQDSTIKMFRKAGFNISISDRSYFPIVDDEELKAILIRPQEMSRYVEDGVLDAGITGKDWILENGSKVTEVAELIYSKQSLRPVRWVVAVADGSKIRSPKDLAGLRISTELVNLTRKYLRKIGIKAEVEYSYGATEVKPPELADAIVEATETGSSLKANNLRVIDTVLESTPRLIANKRSWENPWKRRKIENISLLLNGAILAEEKVGLKMNVSEKNMKRVLSILPAMKKPTISSLSENGWFDIDTIIDEKIVRILIPRLKSAGAEGIIEYPLNKVIY